MTKEEILEAAKEAGAFVEIETIETLAFYKRFAAIIERRTIDRCAEVAASKEREYITRDMKGYWSIPAALIQESIRKLGEQ